VDGVALWTALGSAEDAPAPWKWLALLTALAAVLRAIGLDGGLWYDEIRTLLDSVCSPLYQILTVFPSNNQHTFYSVLAHFSIGAFGEHAWSLRQPSVVFGAATVPVLYLFAREFVGRTEALLASLLLTAAYHHVWFSQNARGCSALAFFTMLSSWPLLRGLQIGMGTAFGALADGALFLVGLWSYFKQSKFVLGMFFLPGAITVAAPVGLRRPIFPR
jgi:4-amino-4-deoxy-L-arabinose transferase-like glycosyltransferase